MLEHLFLQITQGDAPGRVRLPEQALDITAGDIGKLLAALDRVQVAVIAHRTQQGNRQRPRTHASLNHPRPGKNIGHGHNLAGILGIDHRGTSRHGLDKVAQQRPENMVLQALAAGYPRAFRTADDLVMIKIAFVGVELTTRRQADDIQMPTLITEQDTLPCTQRATSLGRPYRYLRCGWGRWRAKTVQKTYSSRLLENFRVSRLESNQGRVLRSRHVSRRCLCNSMCKRAAPAPGQAREPAVRDGSPGPVRCSRSARSVTQSIAAQPPFAAEG
ncbi:hypothetical protein D3C77_454100 [compost metagenome]